MVARSSAPTLAVLALAGTLALGCGGATRRRDAANTQRTAGARTAGARDGASAVAPSRSGEPRGSANEAIVTIGTTALTRSMLRSWAAIEGQGESAALSSLIRAEWAIGEAAAGRSKAAAGRSKVAAGRSKAAAATPTPRSALAVEQLSEQIYRELARHVPAIARASVAAYYERRRASFVSPERRDLHIVRAASEAAAQRAKRELEDGASFATVVARTAQTQPVSARHGLLLGLSSTDWPEPTISDAVFHAPLKALRGPVQVRGLGYYVFEVLRRTPTRQKALAEVAPEITSRLAQRQRERALSRFAAELARRWAARTDCPSSRAVELCTRSLAVASRDSGSSARP